MQNQQIINNLLNSDLTVYKNLQNLWNMARIEEDYKLNDFVWNKAIEETKKGKKEFFDLYRQATFYGAQNNFDKYLIACEMGRTPNARFYLPRRSVLEGKHKIISQIQEFIDDEDTVFLGLSMPPGTGKTTLIKFLLAYIAGRYPTSANMYVSYAGGMIEMMYQSVKSILTEDEYMHRAIFPKLPKVNVNAKYSTISYKAQGDVPTIGLVSLGASITGRTRANKFLVTDDLVKDKQEARSPERLFTLWDDYRSTVTSRTIGRKFKQIMLGTIWSINDPLSRMRELYKNDKRYKFIAIPVCNEDYTESNFEYNHPDNYTIEKILEKKEMLDPIDFSCLYMQHPLEKEGLAFNSAELRYYNGVLPDGEPDNILFYCDVAWGGGDSLSMPIGYVYGGDCYIHDVLFSTGDKTVTKPRVVSKILLHNIKMGRFEANNGGGEYADDIDRILKEKYSYSCNISHKKAPNNMAKQVRIEQHAPEIKNFYFIDEKHRDEDYKKFMFELTGYSFIGKNLHDDAPDSLAGLADYTFRRYASVEVCKRPF